MIISNDSTFVSLRLSPGDNLLTSVSQLLDDHEADGGAVIAAAGSLEFLRYSVVKPDVEGIPRYTDIIEEVGAIEVTGLQGHLGRETDNTATSHLHGTFALSDGKVIAGHVFGARALVTVELTVALFHDVAWQRSSVKYGKDHEMPTLVPTKKSASRKLLAS